MLAFVVLVYFPCVFLIYILEQRERCILILCICAEDLDLNTAHVAAASVNGIIFSSCTLKS